MDALHVEWDEDDTAEVVHEDIPVTIPFAWADSGDRDEEVLYARGDVPFGLLIALEDQSPLAMTRFFAAVFYDDDNERDDQDQPVDGTSSLERWNKLAIDPERRVPGAVLSKVFTGLYGEYATRTGLRGPARPTTRVAPSRAQRRGTGRSSTARPGARASISSLPPQA